MRTERVAPAGVRFRRRGDGDLAVVFVHGFLDDQYVWEAVTAGISTPGIECVTLDLAGREDRTAASGPFDYDRFADEVGSVADALDKPFVLVGHSMGAAVAELVAARRPPRAVGLVLLTPVPLAGTRLPDEVIGRFRSLGGDPDAQRAIREQVSVALPEADLDRLVDTGVRVRPEVVRDFADCWNTGHPAGARPSRFTGPVLIVRGAGDGFVTEDMVGAGAVPRFGSARTQGPVSVAGAGHWVHVEQPSEVCGRIDRFLAGLRTSAGGKAPGTAHPQGWISAFEQKSATAFGEALAEDVVLEAGALARPVAGRDRVKSVMGAASNVYESLAFTHETVDSDRTYLEWRATAFGGMRLEGVTILTKDGGGRIVRIAIHHRPLGAALRFSTELRERLRDVIDSDHFYQS
ncbi:alpha/beta hydrolase [Streptomyces sp. NPDC047022]|uniref:alpha/beta hydrolase n=1 Tax=Streptomyces sp. NPDC047022 TaxID=3155737 RepID=UPI003406543E